MTGTDLVSDAIAELYAGDPEDFIKRRRHLAAQARSAGDREAAKTIAGLGKPTRSAWVVNRLVHADPSVTASLAELGGRLRSGEAALDGASIRELSRERRELVDGLVRRALEEAGQRSASVALRDEVTDTFNAALADPEVGEQVAAGTLQKAVHWAGFGPGIGSAISSGPTRAPAQRAPAADSEEAQGRAGPGPAGGGRRGGGRRGGGRPAAGRGADLASAETDQAAAEAKAQAEAQAMADAEARAEREREEGLALVASAERDAEEASRAADAAAATEREISESVTFMQERLNREQQRLVQARRDTRQAAAAATRSKQTLERLRRRFSS